MQLCCLTSFKHTVSDLAPTMIAYIIRLWAPRRERKEDNDLSAPTAGHVPEICMVEIQYWNAVTMLRIQTMKASHPRVHVRGSIELLHPSQITTGILRFSHFEHDHVQNRRTSSNVPKSMIIRSTSLSIDKILLQASLEWLCCWMRKNKRFEELSRQFRIWSRKLRFWCESDLRSE